MMDFLNLFFLVVGVAGIVIVLGLYVVAAMAKRGRS